MSGAPDARPWALPGPARESMHNAPAMPLAQAGVWPVWNNGPTISPNNIPSTRGNCPGIVPTAIQKSLSLRIFNLSHPQQSPSSSPLYWGYCWGTLLGHCCAPWQFQHVPGALLGHCACPHVVGVGGSNGGPAHASLATRTPRQFLCLCPRGRIGRRQERARRICVGWRGRRALGAPG